MNEPRTAHPFHLYDAIVCQPERVARVLAERRAEIEAAAEAAARCDDLTFIGIGTSLHAAQVTDHFFRHLTGGRLRVRAEHSFEVTHSPYRFTSRDAAIVITHTGTSGFSVEAFRQAKAAGALTIGICGENCGEAMRASDFLVTTCEQEASFTYTKSYTTSLAALALFAIEVAKRRGVLNDEDKSRAELEELPATMRRALETQTAARALADAIREKPHLVFFGSGPNWATASEAALKIKEASYLWAEGFETEQLLHGPFSAVESRAALTAILTGGPGDDRAKAILRAAGEVGAMRTAVCTPEARSVAATEYFIEVPPTPEWLSPLVHLLPLQFLTYYLAMGEGTNPDSGRLDQPAHKNARKTYEF